MWCKLPNLVICGGGVRDCSSSDTKNALSEMIEAGQKAYLDYHDDPRSPKDFRLGKVRQAPGADAGVLHL